MIENKRTVEASCLRAFFDEQIEHLQGLLHGLDDYFHEIERVKDDDLVIEDFVEIANNKMRAVDSYADKLRQHVRKLYGHVLSIADEIPEPVALNPTSFQTNALVNAMFVNYQDIEKLMGNNPEIKQFLQQYKDSNALYAILTANKVEKNTLGVGMQGDMLVRDVAQQEVNFSSYQIHTPCPNNETLSSELKTYLFNCVVKLIKQEMEEQLKNQPLHQSYEDKVNSLANPDVYLNTLIKRIENPAQLLSIDKTHFKLNKLGVKLNEQNIQNANEFDVYELVWCDDMRVVVLRISHDNQGLPHSI